MTGRSAPAPRATYRLQLNSDFTFDDAAGLAPYLGKLGISHAYLSPILKARRGSAHGYDTVDHTRLDPALGTLDEFRALAAALRAGGIGIVLDIVPNHVGVGGDENALWLDVLEWGPHSRYADWFDINWSPTPPRLKGKILVPFLGVSYAEALRSGDLDLRWDAKQGEFSVWSSDTHKLPLCLESYPDIIAGLDGVEGLAERCKTLSAASEEDIRTVSLLKAELAQLLAAGSENGQKLARRIAWFNSPDGAADRDRLIQRQFWRPARYSVAADEINYRRFFIVSDLAGFRVESDEVFEHVHRLTFQLVEEGLIDGLRIDHVDGLFDPKAYLLKLRQACPRPIYLVVEKILAPGEMVRDDWQVEGTTGYEFITEAVQVITDPDGEAALTAGYRALTGDFSSVDQTEREAKFVIMDFEMAAELDSLADLLHALAQSHSETRDLTRHSLRNGLREYVAAMEVYRTYVDDGPLHVEDRRRMSLAMARARRLAATVDPAVFDFVERVVSGELCRTDKHYDAAVARDAARRVQQFTGPVMAKGLEDTALYRYNRLLSLSDVGHKPDRFSATAAQFHDFNAARQAHSPLGMVTSSSHDTKRGEDVRARLAALSGCPEAWLAAVAEWQTLLMQAGAPEIHANDSYYLLQTLLGAWPAEYGPESDIDAEVLETFGQRVEGALMKALREARLRSNWSRPDTDYEDKVYQTLRLALTPSTGFLESFRRFEARLAPWGAENGLIVTALKLTVPGVPDIYQGAEFWEQSLVDPDNRRAVDFARHNAALDGTFGASKAVENWRDGRLKQHMIARLLELRKRAPELFAEGSYEPIAMADATHFAFRRQHGDAGMVVAVRRFPWRDSASERLGTDLGGATPDYRIVLGEGDAGTNGLAALFDRYPVFVAANI
jgi:(1->4)-alpha-D-glucan 1-alpha-D-glucosylmutase